MRRVWPLVCATLLLGCTPADVEYCRGLGVEGTSEYGKCLDYYQQQQSAFSADRSACEREADVTYPPTLYDHGGYAHTLGGFGPHGELYSGQTIFIDPDYQHNREVDRLRMRIIQPCMQSRGWNSATNWQAGRHAVKPPKPASAKLPWLK